MHAIVCHASKDLRVEPQAESEPLLPGQLRVRIARGGICGSDLHYYQHGGFGTVRLREPMVLGHEVSAVIDAVGGDTTDFAPGQRIAVSPSRPCGGCRFCHQGLPNHCLNMRFYGSAMPFPHIQGAFRESLVIDVSQAHRLADDLSLAEGAMAEPLSVGLHAIQRAGAVFGKRILVTGCGPIGNLLIASLRAAGAAEIVAVDLAAGPLECARRMGASRTHNLAEEPTALQAYAAQKGYFDVMFEVSGSAQALRDGLERVAPRGVVVTVGLGGDVSLPLNLLVSKEIDLRGTFRFHGEFAQAVDLLNRKVIDVRPVISHTVPFTRAIEAFELAADKSQAMKVLLDFGVPG
ncbi:L-idonate 5-dehydrogenase [Pseudomonas gingeri]|uniref:L-idonate 5-dehydrogenase n=1 Tax=Pseudomonas gingeri TaxID=117681 RepID=UPI00159FC4A5|nr:L-idonate 5-dehydrogenase [Pseudomonas gingeri]NWA02543.1 L-idonate 5-dehydrogenase [Pseudomonas gingeri]NWA12284.1 L-idonate 5-dehydrogenase [Pseudomonas gingeri]NWA57310.1 L-idonate 5-dehydrogenase [Pseudomonas gingeri]NWA93653.1 L-idonate 5-dehydrogenase [Pseudomonas gingeri]NWB03125.1 L-idonate 5-dehydrogenase [Pseudomonas gingeri]